MSESAGAQELEIEVADRLAAYWTGLHRLREWTGASMSLALLEAALTSGVLDAARRPQSADEIARATGLKESRVTDLCMALYGRGILDEVDGLYELAPPFALLMDPDAPTSLKSLLDTQHVTERILRESMRGDNAYSAMGTDDLVRMARGSSFNPGSSLGLALHIQVERDLPQKVRAIYERGGRHLELGCGIGSSVLAILRVHPKVTAVGVEREAVLVSEARRQAAQLHVEDRVEWRVMDARDVDEVATFDTVAWSQFFFPTQTRAASLEVARRALKPGGYLSMPLLPEAPATVEGLREPSGRYYTIARMIYGSWDVPLLSAAQLEAEVESAGFELVGLADTALVRILVAQRPPDDICPCR